MTEEKICKDCFWVRAYFNGTDTDYLCTHPQSSPNQGKRDIVTGDLIKPFYLSCRTARVEPCGPSGTFWKSNK